MFLTNTNYSEYYRPEDLCSEGLISEIQILNVAESVQLLAEFGERVHLGEELSIEQILNDLVLACRDEKDANVAFHLQWEQWLTALGEDFLLPEEYSALRMLVEGIWDSFTSECEQADVDLVKDRWYVIGMRAYKYIILAKAQGLELNEESK